ncbi:hypothetical protein MNBD_GAMMA12-1970 [hydrothermal vent metagenome]|uniref:Radical SAM core domain-containing protein n=1 Tax=hydrothermal vent metagenome TaxID=652676 RepID=A0A3B0ZKV4_9ZZZZ
MNDPIINRQLIHKTSSLCNVCKNVISASVYADSEKQVWMVKSCDEHGQQQVRLSDNADWYQVTRATQPRPTYSSFEVKDVEQGCPFDCGPCTSHQQKTRLSVVTITSACNLDCPICYVFNKNDNAYHMSIDEFKKTLSKLERSVDNRIELINLTGGDPTLHPDLIKLLELSNQYNAHRLSLCTNGIKLTQDEDLLRSIASNGARVALSFDSFERGADYTMQAAHLVDLKLKCIDLLEKYKINTTLIPVVAKGLNDHELGRFIELTLTRPNIRHLEFHTITFTGQGGKSFDPERKTRISMHEVLERIEQQCDGVIVKSDFMPSACAHSLCYQVCYLLVDPEGGAPVPFLRFMDKAQLYDCLKDELYLEPSAKLETALRQAIDSLWIEGSEESTHVLSLLKSLLGKLFPSERAISQQEALTISEQRVKTIYIHSHMDEETWDNERIMMCCDSNCYPDGSSIPVCASNVLYRETEARFTNAPLDWDTEKAGETMSISVESVSKMSTVALQAKEKADQVKLTMKNNDSHE